jgi:hypothetical protein
MKVATLLAAATLFAAAPTFATSTIECNAAGRARLGFYLNVGSGPGQAISGVHLFEGRTEVTAGLNRTSPAIAQSWIDERDLRLDLIDSNAEHYVARLNARKTRQDTYVGTLVYNGRTYPMTCTWQD